MKNESLKEQAIDAAIQHIDAKVYGGIVRGLESDNPITKKNRYRNKNCPCGSRKKFKNCCWSRY